MLSRARGPHKYTFKRHVARSSSNLVTMNFWIIITVINTSPKRAASLRDRPLVLNINACKCMLCLFELQTPPSCGTQRLFSFDSRDADRKYQMPAVCFCPCSHETAPPILIFSSVHPVTGIVLLPNIYKVIYNVLKIYIRRT